MLFQLVVAGHFIDLAVFLAEAQPPALFLREVILAGERDDSTGVAPLLTERRGPLAECAGFDGITWPVTSQSNSMRMEARCCLIEGGDISLESCSM
ncbi:MAG TPA: hypothetical protein VMF50_17930 [Candidatus Binataceae bacterium]|nr:hypothetical protein [Candidatus Binataceae bacterium]